MDVSAYLRRIDYQGEPSLAWETLCDLQTAHLLAVPFENLDIHLGRPITLDLKRIYQKVVVDKRGGFCYELNGLYAWLLTELGFKTSLIAAQVYSEEKQRFGIPFDHLAIAVTLGENPWLTDVGFGHAFSMPLNIMSDAIQATDEQKAYQIRRDAESFTLSIQEGGGAWRIRYRFDLEPRAYEAFQDGCTYHQTSPDSGFTQGRLCSQARPNGRITLTDDQLIVTQDGERVETAVADNTHFLDLLHQHFGIVLPPKAANSAG